MVTCERSTLTVPIGQSPSVGKPPSRVARRVGPLAPEAVRQLAVEYGVCPRPVSLRRTDLTTGLTEVVDMPCGATMVDKCAVCAAKAKRLRQVQLREGWHRTDEPADEVTEPDEGQHVLLRVRAHLLFEHAKAEANAEWDQLADLQAGIAEIDGTLTQGGLRGTLTKVTAPGEPDDDVQERRVRSTKRRQDAPDLPRKKVQPVTVGRTFTGKDGRTFQPSTFLTVTLDSYGRVGPDGTPVDPAAYDYRRAAWDAVHFPALLDRFWQNLRRAVGWNVQYCGSVEPQRRLAPHGHFAVRGTFARELLRAVLAGTYHQVWWPSVDVIYYDTGRLPEWDPDVDNGVGDERGGYVDPDTRRALLTWDEALDELDARLDAAEAAGDEMAPVHVVRFGEQFHARGLLAGTREAERHIGYIAKYIGKQVDKCHVVSTDRQAAHFERLWAELKFTPCSPRCANWLRYGVQPKNARKGMRPGHCKGKVHQRSTLGIGGRRILVSRQWSGKTLADHRYDARAWVRALLAGSTSHDQAPVFVQDGAEPWAPGSPSPYAWEIASPHDRDVAPIQHRLLRAVSARIQQRKQLQAAKDQAARDGPDVSATGPVDGSGGRGSP